MNCLVRYIPEIKHALRTKRRFAMEEGGTNVVELPVDMVNEILERIMETEERLMSGDDQASCCGPE